MSLCKNYELYDRYTFTYDTYTGARIPHKVTVGVCLGTKEQDECSCEGNRCNCDFYTDVREKAKQQKREEDIPTRISDLIIKVNGLDLSGYENEEIRRAETVNELVEIKTIIERRNT